MEEISKLTAILNVLDSYFDKITEKMSKEELTVFEMELKRLKETLLSTDNPETLTESAKDFFQTISNIDYLQDLIAVEGNHVRYGDTPEIEEHIKRKLAKACQNLIDKIHPEKDS
jgi:hypothetical protein